MEASNNQGKAPLLSAAPASKIGGEATAPLKLQFEVTFPQELDRELKAWRKAFERVADVMERWLESALAHPGFPPPPAMPWTMAPPNEPPPLPPVHVAPTRETPASPLPPPPPPSPPLLAPRPILPDDMAPMLVEEPCSIQVVTATPDAQEEKPVAPEPAEVRPAPVEETEAAAAERSAAAEEAALHAQKGERCRAAGNKDKALVCYREALDLDPDCTQAYLGRASIYIEQGRFSEALLDCNAALKREPERAVLYVLRGLVHARQGNLKGALDEAEEAIRYDPQLPSAYMLRGNARFKRGRYGEALDDVKTAIRLRPTDAKFHAELARMLAQTGQHEQAARTYAKVLNLSPNVHEARLQRGVALRQAGQAAAAEAELTEYLRRRPSNAAAHYQRGLCRVAQRNYAQAMTDFDKAIALKPDDLAVYEAREKTLQQWEGTARQSRPSGAAKTAATVAVAATAMDAPAAVAATATEAPAAVPTRSFPTPPRPTPTKTTPAKTKPAPSCPAVQSRYSRDDDDEPSRWMRPAKWTCIVAVVGLLGFGGFRLLASVIHNPYKPDAIPPASAALSAEDLWQRYQSNPDAAKAELSEHIVEVTGMVARHFDDKAPPVVILSVAGSNATVACTLKANFSIHQQMLLSRIQGDSKAVIIGSCVGPQGNTIALNECLLIKVIRGSVKSRP